MASALPILSSLDTEEKVTVGVLAALALGGVVAAFLFLKKPAGMLKPAGSGWSNEEQVQVVRNEEGLIDHIIIHRDVHNQ